MRIVETFDSTGFQEPFYGLSIDKLLRIYTNDFTLAVFDALLNAGT